MFALIQSGYAIFGVGETADAARLDAAECLEGGATAAATAEEERGLHGKFREDGALVVVPCSAVLAAYVREHGTTTYAEGDGEICLPSELDD